MDELSCYSAPIVGFKALNTSDKQFKLIDSSTATNPLPLKSDVAVETHTKYSQETQTEACQTLAKNIDERKLANWLQKVYANVDKELLKDCMPVLDSYSNEIASSEIIVQPYQKLSVAAATDSQGLATWLSVFTNNAPVLVVTSVAPHADWCEHVNQCLKLFIPRRVENGTFVTYKEEKIIPIKACLRSLCTNSFNKNIFAGSTFDGDIYIWQYEQNYHNHKGTVEINELYHTTLPHGYAVALDWSNEFTLLTAHSNGNVLQWHLDKDIIKETEYLIKPSFNTSADICTLLALNINNFVVGTTDGAVLHCTCSTAKHRLEIVSLKKHLFMTTTLLKTYVNGHKIVISCDISGQVYFHDLRNSNHDTDTIATQIPLPFTNTIACSRDGGMIYYPGDDGSLEYYRICDGSQNTAKGALKGKGNFIKSSDNGFWIITGLYQDEFQIFCVESSNF